MLFFGLIHATNLFFGEKKSGETLKTNLFDDRNLDFMLLANENCDRLDCKERNKAPSFAIDRGEETPGRWLKPTNTGAEPGIAEVKETPDEKVDIFKNFECILTEKKRILEEIKELYHGICGKLGDCIHTTDDEIDKGKMEVLEWYLKDVFNVSMTSDNVVFYRIGEEIFFWNLKK